MNFVNLIPNLRAINCSYSFTMQNKTHSITAVLNFQKRRNWIVSLETKK